MKYIFIFIFLLNTGFAEMDLFQKEPKISVNNSLLAKVNGTTISVLDVMKKMDLLLHQNYPQHANVLQARYQFYTTSWRPIFMEMIDTELILSDAQDKEVKLTDGEVREEMELRFGPSILTTLEKIGLPYDDAWKMVKNDLIVRRMMWYFAQSRAMQSISPQAIRDSYQCYLKEHPAYQEWIYRVISLRADQNSAELAQNIYQLLVKENQSPESVQELKKWETEHPDCKVQISTEYNVKNFELSESHKNALIAMTPGNYSQPISQTSRSDMKTVYRIFYLSQKTDHPAPEFETMSNQLKNELMQKSIAKESETYVKKLRKHYGFDPASIKDSVPDDLQPFHLE